MPLNSDQPPAHPRAATHVNAGLIAGYGALAFLATIVIATLRFHPF